MKLFKKLFNVTQKRIEQIRDLIHKDTIRLEITNRYSGPTSPRAKKISHRIESNREQLDNLLKGC